ncbi:asparagine synthase (glutamine-hydrolyzing) [cf. Phormidesmis sp. LEGE 11477]|uniref:asparagine synthase (glutamine-hydrolyzing) n=1 Tax=cf. Phormidesmis sp. LEGE 11477 TaxID=1828680 RepID=UPI001881363F|nr:asparagine synthase (glutamine-hydrolyzing) [cf. Phormidesmis sp. LEGE 11477]MBE9063235.1 asparagine synthase (glutamine-hydrolyzing) [cf. Phormidesmis sp. LEGE 11477]
MCGIAGIMHHESARAINPDWLVAMAAIQYHRGPDGFGQKVLPGSGVGFSHARLSIIDLNPNRGRQPFWTDDEQYMIAHNGEFYDYKRLRADLTSRGDRFTTKSDTELLLHLTKRYGLTETMPHLRGEFAFAMYEKQAERLTLVRDRFGVKPLYWTMTAEGLVFGSEIKVLFAHPGVRRAFSDQGLYHQLIQTMVPGTTCFEGVYAVQPGQMVICERREGRLQIRTHTYWDMDFPQRGGRTERSEEETIEQLRHHFVEAIQLRLEADVPVACYLSGGIDSCSILGVAAACQQSPVKAFTIGFDDGDYDETAIAQEMAAAVGADQDILRVQGSDLYDHFARTIWHTERSIYNTFTVAKLLMSEHVQQAGYKVVVTGEGSDELFAGYPQLRLDMILHGMEEATPAERAELEAWLQESNRLFKGNLLAQKRLDDPALTERVGFTPSCLQSWLSSAPRAMSLLSSERRQALDNYSPGAAIAQTLDPQQLAGRHPLDKAQYVWIKTQFESQVLGWAGDRVDMANSMEARPAFLDHPLVEFAVTVPPTLRFRDQKDKYILRETMKELLPETLYNRQKFAFMAPPAHTDPAKQKAMLGLGEQYLSKKAVAATGLLDATAVSALFERYHQSETPVAEQVQLDATINHLLSVQILHDRFIAADIPKIARDRADALGWHVGSD